MPELREVVVALIAICALLTSPLIISRRIRRWVICVIISLVAINGAVSIVIDRGRAKEEANQRKDLSEIAQAISQLRNNSNEEKAAKESQVRHNRQVREGLEALIDKGAALRIGCQGVNPSQAEEKWSGEAEEFLNHIGPSYKKEFLRSSELVPGQPCFPRINAHVFILEKIRDRFPSG